ncbi:MAG: AAA family ATPase [Candidatus Daviesbacteria bacterium]|nr:AAA family ATPase [Candidatus Daviesbacteria bacterium]
MQKISRIFIVGSPGAGKTTLAKRLSKKFGIPHYDLDEIRFPDIDIKRSDEEAQPYVKKLTEKPSFIIEGIYISWIEKYLKDADKIIFLDTPFVVAIFRVIRRYLQNLLQGHFRHSFISTLVLIKNMTIYHFYQKESDYVTKTQTTKILEQFPEKVINLSSNEEPIL